MGAIRSVRCKNTRCSHFVVEPVNYIGGRSFPGKCNVWHQELDEEGRCLQISYKNKPIDEAV